MMRRAIRALTRGVVLACLSFSIGKSSSTSTFLSQSSIRRPFSTSRRLKAIESGRTGCRRGPLLISKSSRGGLSSFRLLCRLIISSGRTSLGTSSSLNLSSMSSRRGPFQISQMPWLTHLWSSFRIQSCWRFSWTSCSRGPISMTLWQCVPPWTLWLSGSITLSERGFSSLPISTSHSSLRA